VELMSRNDAAFYTDTHDCEALWFSDDKEIVVYRNGEMRIHFTRPDGDTSVLRYTKDLDDVGLISDELLFEADNSGKIEWIHNAWFEVVYHDNEDGEIFLDFEEAMKYAHRVADEYAAHLEGVSGE